MRQIRLSVVALGLSAVALAVSVPCRSDSLLVTGEPFLLNDADIFSIYDSAGTEDRNRAAVTVDGVARNLVVLPNLQPLAGSEIRACLRVNGVDTPVCVIYDSGDWPGPVRNGSSVDVAAGDVVTVHLTETLGVNSGANVRSSFQVSSLGIFHDGFESNGTTAWTGAGLTAPAIIVAGEPFVGAGTDTFSIGGSPGTEERNRAAMPRAGRLRNLYLLPNQQPIAGGVIRACLRVNGVDTALCVSYASADWPNPKGNTATTVTVVQGALVTLHFTEQGTGSNANARASFALGPVASESVGAVVITSEPFLFDNANVFSIAPGSSGTEDRNRAGMPGPGTIRNLFVMPNQQPAVGSDIHACIRVNAVDTALCVVYGSADWPNPKGNTAASVAVAADDIVTVRFTEQAGISSTANVRASFEVR